MVNGERLGSREHVACRTMLESAGFACARTIRVLDMGTVRAPSSAILVTNITDTASAVSHAYGCAYA